MRFLAALLIVLSASLAAAHAAPGDVTAVPDITAREREQAFVARMTGLYPNTMELLSREFPEDHANLMREFARIGTARGEPRALAILAFDRIGELRRAYADLLLEAPPVAQSVMLGRLASFYEAVFAEEGPVTCARFARDGSAVLFELGLATKYAVALDLQSHSYFEAVLLAQRSPAERVEAPGTDDWALVFQVMAASGASPAQMEALGSGDPSHPGLCPAFVRLLRTVGVLDTPEALRLRADFAKNLVGY